jgi:hypothetical protein
MLQRIVDWIMDRVFAVIDPDFDVDWEKDEAYRLLESIPRKDK